MGFSLRFAALFHLQNNNRFDLVKSDFGLKIHTATLILLFLFELLDSQSEKLDFVVKESTAVRLIIARSAALTHQCEGCVENVEVKHFRMRQVLC